MFSKVSAQQVLTRGIKKVNVEMKAVDICVVRG